jgi:hypothetical protein
MKPTRRALLKASLATPAVLSVQPALGADANSALGVCLVRERFRWEDPAFTNRPAPISATYSQNGPPPDDWVRVGVAVVELKTAGSTTPIPGEYYFETGTSTYWLIQNNAAGGFSATNSTFTTTSHEVARSLGTKYALVYIDSTGRSAGKASYNPNNQFAATGSCVTSALGANGVVLAGPIAGSTERRRSSSVMWRRQ